MCYSLFFSFLRSTFLSHFFPLLSSSSPLLLDQVCSKPQVLKSSTFVNMNTYVNGPSLPLHMRSQMSHFRHETALWVKTSLETQALQQWVCKEYIQNRKYSEIIDLPVSGWWLPCILLDRRKACRQRGSWRVCVNHTAEKGAQQRYMWHSACQTAVIKVQLIVTLPFTHTHDS